VQVDRHTGHPDRGDSRALVQHLVAVELWQAVGRHCAALAHGHSRHEQPLWPDRVGGDDRHGHHAAALGPPHVLLRASRLCCSLCTLARSCPARATCADPPARSRSFTMRTSSARFSSSSSSTFTWKLRASTCLALLYGASTSSTAWCRPHASSRCNASSALMARSSHSSFLSRCALHTHYCASRSSWLLLGLSACICASVSPTAY